MLPVQAGSWQLRASQLLTLVLVLRLPSEKLLGLRRLWAPCDKKCEGSA